MSLISNVRNFSCGSWFVQFAILAITADRGSKFGRQNLQLLFLKTEMFGRNLEEGY